MKNGIVRTVSVLCGAAILASSVLTSCGNDKKAADTTETAAQTEEVITLKKSEIIYAKGYWMTDGTGYEGNSDEAQNYVSTQKFTDEYLPVGSEIAVADGYVCRLTKWSKYPETGAAEEISGTYKIADGFWSGTEYCALDLRRKDGGAPDDYQTAVTVSVPESTKNRREFTWDSDGVLSVLTVGNSFSDDAMEYVYDVARSAGVEKIVLGNLYYPSCRLEWHYNYYTEKSAVYEYRTNTDGKWVTKKNAKFEDAFGTYDWDYISFQECAQEVQSKEELYTHLDDLIAAVKGFCPNAKIVWHTPWANIHANYGNKLMTMYRDCMTAARKVIESYPEIEAVITTGTAVQNARTSYIKGSKFLRDGWHLSLDLGRYIAAAAFFTQLTGISVADIGFAPSGLSDDFKQIALEAAENSRLSPRIVTDSKFKEPAK